MIKGNFETIRRVYKGLGTDAKFTIELDKSLFTTGTVYEIELETDTPVEAKKEVVAWLDANAIQHHDSTASKYARFLKKLSNI